MTFRASVLFTALFCLSAIPVLAVVVNAPLDCGDPPALCSCDSPTTPTVCWPNERIPQLVLSSPLLTFDCAFDDPLAPYWIGGADSLNVSPDPIVEITAHGGTLRNCTVQYGFNRGIWAHAANNISLFDNHIRGTSGEPVMVESVGSSNAQPGIRLWRNVIEKTGNGVSFRAVRLVALSASSDLSCNVISSESNGVINDSNPGMTSTCNAFLLYGRKFVGGSSPIAELSNQGTAMHSSFDCVVTVGDSTNPLIPTRCNADPSWAASCSTLLANTCLGPLDAYGAFSVPALNFDHVPHDGILDSVDLDANGTADLIDEDGDGIVDWRDSNQTGGSAGFAETDVFGIGSTGRNGDVTGTEVDHALLVGVQVGLWAAAETGHTNHGVSFHDNRVISVGSRPASTGLFGDGVFVQGADGLQIQNQNVVGTNFGIVTNDAADAGYPFVISGNTVKGSLFWPSAQSFGAIQIQNTAAMTSVENRVEGNTVPRWKGYGIAVAGGAVGAGVSVSGNTLANVDGSAFDFEEFTGSDPINVEAANNSVTSTSPANTTEGFYLSFASGSSSVLIHDNDVVAHTMFDRGSDSYAAFKVFHNVFRPDVTGAVQSIGGARPITDLGTASGNNWLTHCNAVPPAPWSDVSLGTLSIVDPNAYEGTATIERPWDSGYEPGCFGTRPIPTVSESTAPTPPQVAAGSSVTGCGDLNADGIADHCAGAPGYPPQGGFKTTTAAEPGAVLVYFGSVNRGARAQPDVIFTGVGAHDRAGVSIAGNFDFNHDGRPDILIGAEQVDRTTNPSSPTPSGNGKVYVIFFDPTDTVHYPNIADPAVPDTVSLALVGQPGGIPGVVFAGVAFGDQAGYAIAAGGASTVNGGDNILIGAPDADPGGRIDAGAAYVVFGNAGLPGTVSLSLVSDGLPDQVPGKAYLGAAAGDHFGSSTAFTGAIIQGARTSTTGTIAVGAPDAFGKKGTVIATPGDPDTTPIVVDAVGTTQPGFQIRGTQTGELLGWAVADGGDALADGVPDLLIGAPSYDAGASTDAGRVLHTTQTIALGVYSAEEVGTTLNGVIWTGEATGDQLGTAVAGVADVTGDGLDDVVLGAPFVDPIVGGVTRADAGAVYLIDGVAVTGHLGVHSVADVGTTIAGEELTGTQAGEHAGSSIAGTGDLDGDGRDDFVIGAPDKDVDAGTVYVVLRSEPPPVGECGPSGCQVVDLATGAELDAPSGVLATTVSVTVQGILDAADLPAPVPAGKMFFGAARFAPDGQSVLSPYATIHIPTGLPLAAGLAPNEVLPLFDYDGSGWVAAGVNGTTGANPSYPTQLAINATVGILHVYAVFLNDADGDTVRDETDNCPTTPNPNQDDANHDGIGDACQCLNLSCSDGNPCTDDGCAPASGCTHANNSAACSDGNACTMGDACLAGSCRAGAPRDADGDGHIDAACGGDDCGDGNPLVWSSPVEVSGFVLVRGNPLALSWANQGGVTGPGTTYDVISGSVSSGGLSYAGAVCLSSSGGPSYQDSRPAPPPGTASWYLVRGHNSCALGTYGSVPRDAGVPSCP